MSTIALPKTKPNRKPNNDMERNQKNFRLCGNRLLMQSNYTRNRDTAVGFVLFCFFPPQGIRMIRSCEKNKVIKLKLLESSNHI